MPARISLLSLLVAAAMTTAAVAEETERYRLERTQDGFVRMDLSTGQMSICRERGEQLVCRGAVDEREAHQRDIVELESRLEALEQRLAELERRSLLRPDAVLPSQEEFERSLSHMEQFFRRFLGLMRELEEEPTPDRT
jgi:hypothetical protein